MMRGMSLLVAVAVLGSCATAPPPPTRTAKAEQQYQRLVAGKVAQAPVSCMPTFGANDMVVIDENTIAFRSGTSKVYIAHMQTGCTGLNGAGSYALVTKHLGSSGYCRGDIAEVTDTLNHFSVGSCVFGDFTPYVRGG